MAIPRRRGIPTAPPKVNESDNPAQKPQNRPISEQNSRVEQSPRQRSETPQSRVQRPSSRVSDQEARQSQQKTPQQQRSRKQTPTESSSAGTRRKLSVDPEQDLVSEKPTKKQAQVGQDSKRKRPVQQRTQESIPAQKNKPAQQDEVEEGYAIDEETGVKYKVLPGASPDMVKQFNAMSKKDLANLSFSSMKHFFTEAEDFDIDDLNSTAQDFLGHLRVAPDKEEQKRLREERARRKREQNQKYAEEQERLTKKYGSLEPDPDPING